MQYNQAKKSKMILRISMKKFKTNPISSSIISPPKKLLLSYNFFKVAKTQK